VSAEQNTLDSIYVIINQMPPEQSKAVRGVAKRIRGVLLDAHGDTGVIALALVGAQLSAAQATPAHNSPKET
jgi:hypothetical protein